MAFYVYEWKIIEKLLHVVLKIYVNLFLFMDYSKTKLKRAVQENKVYRHISMHML